MDSKIKEDTQDSYFDLNMPELTPEEESYGMSLSSDEESCHNFSFENNGDPRIYHPNHVIHKNLIALTDKYETLYAKLDKHQKSIVDLDICLGAKVSAGAGAGKTLTIIVRVLRMVIKEDISSNKIVMITFTNKAAKEISKRYFGFFEGVLKEQDLDKLLCPTISTIHSFGFRMIYNIFGHSKSILSEYQTMKLVRDAYIQASGVPKVDKRTIKIVCDLIQMLEANNELHYAILPEISRNGNLVAVHLTKNILRDNRLYSTITFLDKLTITHFTDLIKGKGVYIDDPERRQNQIEDISKYADIGPYVFLRTLQLFFIAKYSTNNIDFGDMTFYPLVFLAQHQNLLSKVWSKYDHIIEDESQDQSTSQAALLILSDKDSFMSMHPTFQPNY